MMPNLPNNSVKDNVQLLFSQLYGGIVIPNNLIEQEELDIKLQMNNLGFYDEFKYEEIDYEAIID